MMTTGWDSELQSILAKQRSQPYYETVPDAVSPSHRSSHRSTNVEADLIYLDGAGEDSADSAEAAAHWGSRKPPLDARASAQSDSFDLADDDHQREFSQWLGKPPSFDLQQFSDLVEIAGMCLCNRFPHEPEGRDERDSQSGVASQLPENRH